MGAKVNNEDGENRLDETTDLEKIEKNILNCDPSKFNFQYCPNMKLRKRPSETVFQVTIRLNARQVFENFLNHEDIRFDLENDHGLNAVDYMLSAEDPEYFFRMTLQKVCEDINNSVALEIIKGETFLHIGIRMGWDWLVEYILNKLKTEKDKNPVQDAFGDYPIATAAKYHKKDMFSSLLNIYTVDDLRHCNRSLKSVWYYAFKDVSIAKELISYYNRKQSEDKHQNKTAKVVAESVTDSDEIASLLLQFDEAFLYQSDFLIFALEKSIICLFKKIENIKLTEFVKSPSNFQRLLYAVAKFQNLKGLTFITQKLDKDQQNPQLYVSLPDHKDHWETVIELICLIKEHYTERDSQHKMLENFIKNELKLVIKNIGVHKILQLAASQDAPKYLETILEAFTEFEINFNINTDCGGEPLLFRSCKPGFRRCFEKILSFGADILQTDTNGNNVMHFIIEKMAKLEDEMGMEIHLRPNHRPYCLDKDEIIKNNLLFYLDLIKVIFDHIEHHLLANVNTYKWTIGKALIFFTYKIENNNGYSVMKLAFLKGANTFIDYMMKLDGVLKFVNSMESKTYFNISYLLPSTKHPESDEEYKNFPLPKLNKNKESTCQRTCIEMLEMNPNKELAVATLNIEPMMLLEKKYGKICLVFFSVLMLFHILYMIVFTTVGTQLSYNQARDIPTSDAYYYLAYIFVPIEPIFCLFLLLYFLFQIYKGRKLCTWNTAFQYALLLIYIAIVLSWLILMSVRNGFHDYILSTCLFLGWIGSLQLSRGIKITHYFNKMITHMIIYDVVPILFVYLFILLAFGFAMHVEFLALGTTSAFPTAIETLFLGFNLMMGQGDLVDNSDLTDALGGIGRTAWFIKLVYIVYTVLATVVLLNLVIALMNSSYQQIQNENETNWRLDVIGFGVQIELFFHKLMCKPCKMFKANKLPGQNDKIKLYYFNYKTKKLNRRKIKKESNWALWEDFVCCRS